MPDICLRFFSSSFQVELQRPSTLLQQLPQLALSPATTSPTVEATSIDFQSTPMLPLYSCLPVWLTSSNLFFLWQPPSPLVLILQCLLCSLHFLVRSPVNFGLTSCSSYWSRSLMCGASAVMAAAASFVSTTAIINRSCDVIRRLTQFVKLQSLFTNSERKKPPKKGGGVGSTRLLRFELLGGKKTKNGKRCKRLRTVKQEWQ